MSKSTQILLVILIRPRKKLETKKITSKSSLILLVILIRLRKKRKLKKHQQKYCHFTGKSHQNLELKKQQQNSSHTGDLEATELN